MIFTQDKSNIHMWTIEAQTEQEQKYLERLHFVFPQLRRSGEEILCFEHEQDEHGKWLCDPSDEDRAHVKV